MTMMAGDPSIYQGCGSGCGNQACILYGCQNRRQQQAVPMPGIDYWRQGLNDFYNRPSPQIDLERLADLIVERLKRPEGYQG